MRDTFLIMKRILSRQFAPRLSRQSLPTLCYRRWQRFAVWSGTWKKTMKMPQLTSRNLICASVLHKRAQLISQVVQCYVDRIDPFIVSTFDDSVISFNDSATFLGPRKPIMTKWPRSVRALESDLVALEKHFNLCSDHLADGETCDFNQQCHRCNLSCQTNASKVALSILRLFLWDYQPACCVS